MVPGNIIDPGLDVLNQEVQEMDPVLVGNGPPQGTPISTPHEVTFPMASVILCSMARVLLRCDSRFTGVLCAVPVRTFRDEDLKPRPGTPCAGLGYGKPGYLQDLGSQEKPETGVFAKPFLENECFV